MAIQELQATKELKQKVERLRLSRDLDSKTSSKPPSTDLLKKPDTLKEEKISPPQKNPNALP